MYSTVKISLLILTTTKLVRAGFSDSVLEEATWYFCD